MGYICADGNIAKDPINRINIASNKDPEHLNKYINFLGNTVPLKKYFNKKYEVWEYTVNFCNKEIKDYLISLGITPVKSKTLKVNFPITWDFFRGVFDGDGCVREINKKYIKTSISVEIATASPYFLEQIIKFLTIEGIYFTYRKNVNTYIVTVCRSESIKKLHSLMYSDSSVSLDRKRELFGSLLKKFNRLHLPNSVKAKESTVNYNVTY